MTDNFFFGSAARFPCAFVGRTPFPFRSVVALENTGVVENCLAHRARVRTGRERMVEFSDNVAAVDILELCAIPCQFVRGDLIDHAAGKWMDKVTKSREISAQRASKSSF